MQTIWSSLSQSMGKGKGERVQRILRNSWHTNLLGYRGETEMNIAWFSCGAASAVMCALMKNKIDKFYYCETNSEHPDNKRFMSDVGKWIGREIEILRSEKFSDVDDVIEKRRYLSGRGKAPCTWELKQMVRVKNTTIQDINMLGYTYEEGKRIENWQKHNPKILGSFPLFDHGITKNDCLGIIQEVGIKMPVMYDLGFEHNNCLGCVKSGSVKYWLMTKKHFPEVFEKRAKQEREYKYALCKVSKDGESKRIFLDELTEDMADYETPDNSFECDIFCLSVANKIEVIE
jgi:3'-phosphoadenosine 5'-phosphosulfate sulfotransferase (PAPS reductase)/FAD synthetase